MQQPQQQQRPHGIQAPHAGPDQRLAGGLPHNKRVLSLMLEVIRGPHTWLVIWILNLCVALTLMGLSLGTISSDNLVEATFGKNYANCTSLDLQKAPLQNIIKQNTGSSYALMAVATVSLLIAIRDFLRKDRQDRFQLGNPESLTISETMHILRITMFTVFVAVGVVDFAFATKNARMQGSDVVNCCIAIAYLTSAVLGFMYAMHNRSDMALYQKFLDNLDGGDGDVELAGALPAVDLRYQRMKDLLVEVIRGPLSWLIIWIINNAIAVALLIVNLTSIKTSQSGGSAFIGATYLATIGFTYGLLNAVRNYLRKDRQARYQVGNPIDRSYKSLGLEVFAYVVLNIVALALFAYATKVNSLSGADVASCSFTIAYIMSATMGFMYVRHNRDDADTYAKL